MELFFFNPTGYERLYNCSAYSVDDVPLAKRQHTAAGVAIIMLGTVEGTLYVPCAIALWEMAWGKGAEESGGGANSGGLPCYKLMFLMAVLDMLQLPVCALATGVMGIAGAVFCSAPTTIYVLGTIAFGLWIGETLVEMELAINRFVEWLPGLRGNRVQRALFGGQRIWLWLAAPVVYTIYGIWFPMPPVFTGIYFSLFLNPHVGYLNETGNNMYENDLEIVHNWIVVCVLVGTYTAVAVLLLYTIQHYGGTINAAHINKHKMISLQVALISAVNTCVSIFFVYMQYNPVSDGFIMLTQFLWTQAHGLPPVIYLTMNATIRRRCREMLASGCFRTASWLGGERTIQNQQTIQVQVVSLSASNQQQQPPQPSMKRLFTQRK